MNTDTRFTRLLTILDSYFGPHTYTVLASVSIFLTITVFALLCCIIEITKQ